MDKKKVTLIQVRVASELHKAVKKKAIDQDISVSELIRRLLLEWLEREEPPKD